MLVRLRVVDEQNRLLLVQHGRDTYRSPIMTWRSTGAHRQQLHLVARARLKELFTGWHGPYVNFDDITSRDVVRHGTVVVIALPSKILAALHLMVTTCGGMVMAWPEEVEAQVVFVGGVAYDITSSATLPAPSADAA